MSLSPQVRSLGHSSAIPQSYSPHVLEAVPRALGRGVLEEGALWPYFGEDRWTLFEVGFVAPDGRPKVAVGELCVPAHSPCLVESKSLKLYLFSLNTTAFADLDAYAAQVCRDVSAVVGAPVSWRWLDEEALVVKDCEGTSIDAEPFLALPLKAAAARLTSSGAPVTETLHSHLLRSLCPVTAQPDWATLCVRYQGPKIARAELLHYIAAFFDHQGFHEQCVEDIFLNVLRQCRPLHLTVFARYTRRGGIDINPLRSTASTWPPMSRTLRQ